MAFKIKLTKEQQQYLAAGVLLIGGFGYSYINFFWLPTSKKIKETSDKIVEVEGRIEKATRQAARLPRLESDLRDLNEQAIEAEKRLPRHKSTPEVLVTVGALADKNRVKLLSFSPGPVAKRQFFDEVSYPVQINGTFHNIGRFLAELAMEERIFNVQNVNYMGATGAAGEMIVTFTLLSYQYKG